ncbi:unnamed protein product, partial [Oppiella nova]
MSGNVVRNRLPVYTVYKQTTYRFSDKIRRIVPVFLRPIDKIEFYEDVPTIEFTDQTNISIEEAGLINVQRKYGGVYCRHSVTRTTLSDEWQSQCHVFRRPTHPVPRRPNDRAIRGNASTTSTTRANVVTVDHTNDSANHTNETNETTDDDDNQTNDDSIDSKLTPSLLNAIHNETHETNGSIAVEPELVELSSDSEDEPSSGANDISLDDVSDEEVNGSSFDISVDNDSAAEVEDEVVGDDEEDCEITAVISAAEHSVGAQLA